MLILVKLLPSLKRVLLLYFLDGTTHRALKSFRLTHQSRGGFGPFALHAEQSVACHQPRRHFEQVSGRGLEYCASVGSPIQTRCCLPSLVCQ